MELRECPFCGSGDVTMIWAMGESWVLCKQCKASSGAVTRNDCVAAEAWNTRTLDTTIKELVEALEEINGLGNPWLMRQIAEKALAKHKTLSEHQ